MAMNKQYKKSELTVIDYGSGRKKLFIIYTDYKHNDFGGRYSTRVYPDVRGNKAEATKQALDWLNKNIVGEPWVVRNKESKIFISYDWGR